MFVLQTDSSKVVKKNVWQNIYNLQNFHDFFDTDALTNNCSISYFTGKIRNLAI